MLAGFIQRIKQHFLKYLCAWKMSQTEGREAASKDISSLLLSRYLVSFISQDKKSWSNLSWPLISLEQSFPCCPTVLIQSQLCLALTSEFRLGNYD